MVDNTNDDLQRIIVLMQAQDRDFRVAMKKNSDAMRRMSADSDRELRKVQRQMRAIDQQAMEMAGGMAGWGKAFIGGMAGGIVTSVLGGISSDISGVVKGVAQIGDEAKRAGLGVEEFQQWKYVAEQNRIGVDALVDGFKELSLRADEFVVTGMGSAAEAFTRLGYTATDLRQKLKDPSALMMEILERLQRVDKAAQIRITDELFGGTGGEQLLQLLGMSNEKLREMHQRAKELGLVLDKSAVAAAAEIDRKFSEITGRIASTLKGLFIDLADMSADGAPEFVKVFREISAGIDALEGDSGFRIDLGDYGAANLRGLRMETEAAIQELEALSDTLSSGGKMDEASLIDALSVKMNELLLVISEADKMTPELSQKIAQMGVEASTALGNMKSINGVDFSAAKSSVSGLLGFLGAAADEAMRLRSNMSAMDSGTPLTVPANPSELLPPSDLAPSASPLPVARPMDGYEDWLDRRSNPRGGRGGSGSQSDYKRAVEAIRDQTRALDAEAVAFVAAAAGGREFGAAAEYARRYAELLTAAQKDGRAITPELAAEMEKLADGYVAAAEGADAARDRMDALREGAKKGEDALVNLFESVLDGSRSAKDALGDLLMEMAKVQLQQAVMGAAGGGGIAGFIGGMLTPLAGARAAGGSVFAGRPYLVNENTPNSEVFVPSQSGGILTAAQAAHAMRAASVQPVPSAQAAIQRAEIKVSVYVEDDGKLAAVARRAGAEAAVPVAVEVVKRQAQAQRRK